MNPDASGKSAKVPLHMVLPKETPGVNSNTGVQVEMAFQRNKHQQISLECQFTNFTGTTLTDWAMQFNKNFYGLALTEALNIQRLDDGQTVSAKCEVTTTGEPITDPPSVPFMVQTAIKCSLDVFYFQTPCMFTVLLVENGKLTKEEYKETWQNKSDPKEFAHTLTSIHPDYSSPELVQKRLEDNNIFFVVGRTNDANEFVGYFSCRDSKGLVVLAEVRVPPSVMPLQLTCKTPHPYLAPLFIQGVNFLLSTN